MLQHQVVFLGDAEFLVEYSRTPGSPGCAYKPNGDPGDPPVAPEVEIASVMIGNSELLDLLSPAALSRIELKLCEDDHDGEEDARADAAEARAEARRDSETYAAVCG